jgi:membrane protein DedA with SNARE-associated domain
MPPCARNLIVAVVAVLIGLMLRFIVGRLLKSYAISHSDEGGTLHTKYIANSSVLDVSHALDMTSFSVNDEVCIDT